MIGNRVVMPAPMVLTPKGLGDCGCGCNGAPGGCGGHSHAGLGLFESGLDYQQWGIGEWAAVAAGGYLLISLVGDAFTAKRGVEKYAARRRRRSAIREKYQRELAAA